MSAFAQESPVTPEDLQLLGGDVLAAFLLDHDRPGDPDHGRSGVLHASVSVRGAWNGWITLEVSRAAAHDLTRRMLHDDDVDDDDVRDAVGELVNVLGGNVKSLLVDGCVLGLPEVTDHQHPDQPSVEICRTELWWADHPVTVRVWSAEGRDLHSLRSPA
ncbi:chemotaxis protein CheX [Nocardioides KLBMP 9356]|uniref:Chemotaxis protein CheX n=1 Tax=Nocardioides potassii TaxID=2911371 RepID=A0ABS9HDN2_9ACTN|nr:chemotaxis protein CheX [Nocardioides potassii]MCF6378406.1 chemotaxis protein CheX [Nocardioides potassii]